MANYIETKIRYEKRMEDGSAKKVTDRYLVDALSCTEAEARTIKAASEFISSGYSVTAASKSSISEIIWDDMGADKFYKAKVEHIYLDEKTAAERRTAFYVLVQADNIKQAYSNLVKRLGVTEDFVVVAIAETKIIDVIGA